MQKSSWLTFVSRVSWERLLVLKNYSVLSLNPFYYFFKTHRVGISPSFQWKKKKVKYILTGCRAIACLTAKTKRPCVDMRSESQSILCQLENMQTPEEESFSQSGGLNFVLRQNRSNTINASPMPLHLELHLLFHGKVDVIIRIFFCWSQCVY